MNNSPRPAFKWVNTVPGSLKGYALDVCRWIRTQHLAHYLAESPLTA